MLLFHLYWFDNNDISSIVLLKEEIYNESKNLVLQLHPATLRQLITSSTAELNTVETTDIDGITEMVFKKMFVAKAKNQKLWEYHNRIGIFQCLHLPPFFSVTLTQISSLSGQGSPR